MSIKHVLFYLFLLIFNMQFFVCIKFHASCFINRVQCIPLNLIICSMYIVVCITLYASHSIHLIIFSCFSLYISYYMHICILLYASHSVHLIECISFYTSHICISVHAILCISYFSLSFLADTKFLGLFLRY